MAVTVLTTLTGSGLGLLLSVNAPKVRVLVPLLHNAIDATSGVPLLSDTTFTVFIVAFKAGTVQVALSAGVMVGSVPPTTLGSSVRTDAKLPPLTVP